MNNSNTPAQNNQPLNSNSLQEIDWEALSPQIIEDVAHRLMAHRPHQIVGKSLRFGNNGSFAVDPHQGVFYDFEEDGGGGVFQMVKHLLDCDNSQAFQWLSNNGYLDGTFTQSHRNTIPHNRRKRNDRNNTGNWDGFEAGLKLWKEAEPIPFRQTHPVRRWCLHKNGFPGYSEIPRTIRWHPEYKQGVIIVAMASLQDFINAHPDPPEPRQFHLIAIDAQGRKRNTFAGDNKRTWGTPGVACVALFGNPSTDEIYIAEGIADAIAIFGKHSDTPAIATVGGLTKLKNCPKSLGWLSDSSARAVTIFPDNDAPGRKGRDVLMEAIGSRGGDVCYVENWRDADPADAAVRGGGQ